MRYQASKGSGGRGCMGTSVSGAHGVMASRSGWCMVGVAYAKLGSAQHSRERIFSVLLLAWVFDALYFSLLLRAVKAWLIAFLNLDHLQAEKEINKIWTTWWLGIGPFLFEICRPMANFFSFPFGSQLMANFQLNQPFFFFFGVLLHQQDLDSRPFGLSLYSS